MRVPKQAIGSAIVFFMLLSFCSAQMLGPIASEVTFVQRFMERNLLARFPTGWNYENVASMCDDSWEGIVCMDAGSNSRIIALYVVYGRTSPEKRITPFPVFMALLAPQSNIA